MQYFIAVNDVEWSDSRWLKKGGRGYKPERREGFIGLFDRNTATFQWFKIVRPALNRYGWITESDVPPCPYWARQIRPVDA